VIFFRLGLRKLRAQFVEFVAARYGAEAGTGSDGVAVMTANGGDKNGDDASAARGVSLRDVRLLTAVHFFSIVPLHDIREHQTTYLRMCESLLCDEGLIA
jgi:hypothetical protein